MNYYKKENKIILEIPFWSKRTNPYMVDENGEYEDMGEYPTLTGLIVKEKNGMDKIGFAYTIDMGYKDKGDQYTDVMFAFDGGEEDFKKLCKEFDIDYIELDYRHEE